MNRSLFTKGSRRCLMLASLWLAAAAAPFPAFAAQPTSTVITLNDEVSIAGQGATASDGHVLISAGGVYEIRGVLGDGQIEVDAPGADVEMILDGVQMTSSDGPVILVRDAGTATLTLAPDSLNRLDDGGGTDASAVIAADVSLTIGGKGTLYVLGTQHEGIESSMHLTFTGGDIRVWAVDDGINANNDDVSEITITGGTLYVESETGDGIDSNGTITITGGEVTTLGSMNDKNGGLDADGDITIDGGEVIATGARQPMPALASRQPSLLLQFDETQEAGTLVVIQDAAGDDVLVFAPIIPFQQLLVSTPGLMPDQTYTYFIDGTAEGETVNGRYPSASDPGTQVGSVTASRPG